MREQFIDRKFQPDTLEIIRHADTIINEYIERGFRLTLRQLYYQFVARKLKIAGKPFENKQSNYKRLGSIVSDARLAGLLDWRGIEDRTRELDKLPSWSSPAEIIEAVSEQYREDIWSGQPNRVEVWVEKEALAGVLEPVCREFRVPLFACRGNVSQSALYESAKRFGEYVEANQVPIVLHLGDHDPSGIDMTRDNTDRLSVLGMNIEVRRLALNMDQVRQYDPPPNPAKESDSRFDAYAARYGLQSWELDALPPDVLDGLIRAELDNMINLKKWNRSMASESKNKNLLRKVSLNWDDVKDNLP